LKPKIGPLLETPSTIIRCSLSGRMNSRLSAVRAVERKAVGVDAPSVVGESADKIPRIFDEVPARHSLASRLGRDSRMLCDEAGPLGQPFQPRLLDGVP
jgi:hypothetical protein